MKKSTRSRLTEKQIDEMATPLRVKYPGAYYHGINDPDYAV